MRTASKRVKLAAVAVVGLVLVYLCILSVPVSRLPISRACDAVQWGERRLRPPSAYSAYTSQQRGACDVGHIMSKLSAYSDLTRFTQCQRVFYNRVPKCGSRTVLSTFKILARSLHYTVAAVERYGRRSHFSNVSLMDCFMDNVTKLQPPFIYSQHVNYIDFSRYGLQSPIYINVIRDPLERLISHYYYNMYGSNSAPLATPRPSFNQSLDNCVAKDHPSCMKIFQIIPYFCGHDRSCRVMSRYSLQRAKRQVQEHFLTVGLNEDLPAFMEVLETIMPQFFTNATQTFKANEGILQQLYKTVRKNEVSAATQRKLKIHLRLEYDFYYFVKQRFYNLLSRIRSLRKQRDLDQQLTDWWSPGKTDDPQHPVPDSHYDASNILSQDKDRTRKLDDSGIGR